jgi:type II secretory pathway component PulF
VKARQLLCEQQQLLTNRTGKTSQNVNLKQLLVFFRCILSILLKASSAMEDALQKVMKESGSTKYASVATSAHKALGEFARANNNACERMAKLNCRSREGDK